jgi:hypothetical protein
MMARTLVTFATAFLLLVLCVPLQAHAENQMGYRLLAPEEAAGLPHNHGALGLDVERVQQITDGGMTFDIMRVKQVRRGSTGAQAGFNVGDKIIAVNGLVFPSIAVFAAYIASVPPGGQITVDYIPAGEGPQQAQRVVLVVGRVGSAELPSTSNRQGGAPTSTGMSTGAKVAIGLGVMALLSCYERGCFSHRSSTGNAGRQ